MNLKSLKEELKKESNDTLKLRYLRKNCPCLYFAVLKKLYRHDLVESFMMECKGYENDYKNYSWDVHGYLLPRLDYQR